ncbi:hypothetical protein HY449_03740 [Candidatus Pacearchaeota archaeon]|nr:hypothetical protein [Candidatus Pacearchaeota archaeon]
MPPNQFYEVSSDKRKFLRKFWTYAAVTAILLATLGGFAYSNNKKNKEEEIKRKNIESVLGSRESSIARKVVRGDTFWAYAARIQQENDCLNGIGTNNIVKYLRKINPGAEDSKLRPGMQILLPEYNSKTCKRLKDF